ncbi:MAG: Na/Pi cotransporter family protein [Deltaproteobacteria bacterium]|nr:Na/Pi cotransporter family protein [Deltaproteobacteria bacterium]MBW2051814.1 Na/Pi cotransporter family protein [Deltaproteobacteria bacterium]MBW2322426.1 Na/Pi cotransporter family protein [Deltaproteobacteria bacterium]
MSYTEILFASIGGLGLFIFGMKTMSENLQRVAGARLRNILAAVSVNRIVACITGALITGAIQSSSATAVMLVGFVNARLLTFAQAVGVVLGANIGTTVTAQLIAFKITEYALPAIGIGVAMKLFAKKRRNAEIGGVILGLGLVFFGMVTMKTGVAPLKDSAFFIEFFTRFQADSYWGIILCVMVGALLTMLLQSSSATVGLTMTLASQGLIGLPGAVALVLGENIGTTITAELASIGSDKMAHRTARAHTLFNVIGVTYMVILFPFFIKLVIWVTSSLLGLGPAEEIVNGEQPNIPRYIAIAHTMFNVVNAVFFLIFFKALIKAAIWLTPGEETEEDIDMFKPKYLDPAFIEMPAVGLEQARQEIRHMGDIANLMMEGVINALNDRKLKELGQWRHREDALDILQREITDYLVRISQCDCTLDESKLISSMVRMTNNIERIGDSVENIAELIEEMIENDLYLADEGITDFQEMSQKVTEFFHYILESINSRNKDTVMDKAREMENEIDVLKETLRHKYLSRLRTGVCTIDPGIIFTDMVNNLEKIGDYCFNIAQAVAGIK